MAKVITRTGKGAAITQAENDSNLDSFCGINEPQTGTTYTVDVDDQNNIIELLNASTVTVTLTLISTLIAAIDTSDFKITLKNIGAGSVVVTPTTDTFDDGDATKALAQYEWLTIQTNNAQNKWNVTASSDASKVDGLDASQFLRSDENDTTVGNLTIEKSDATIILNSTGNNATVTINNSGTLRSFAGWIRANDRYQIDMYDTDGSTPRARINLTELGKVDIALGDFQLASVDVTASATELNYNDVTALGDVQASKTVTADVSGDVNFPAGTTLKIQDTELVDLIYPVGAIFLSTINASPDSILGGTWSTMRTGQVLISESGSYLAGSSYGSSDGVAHNHPDTFTVPSQTTVLGTVGVGSGGTPLSAAYQHGHTLSGSVSNNTPGSNDNMQSSLAVYMWRRAA